VDFLAADPNTTGQVMQFRVVPPVAPDPTTPAQFLQLPAITPLPQATVTVHWRSRTDVDVRRSSLDGPAEAHLGTVAGDPNVAPGGWTHQMWEDPVTENPAVGVTEIWELYNATADAHPMHVHEVTFEVVNRQNIMRTRSPRRS